MAHFPLAETLTRTWVCLERKPRVLPASQLLPLCPQGPPPPWRCPGLPSWQGGPLSTAAQLCRPGAGREALWRVWSCISPAGHRPRSSFLTAVLI